MFVLGGGVHAIWCTLPSRGENTHIRQVYLWRRLLHHRLAAEEGKSILNTFGSNECFPHTARRARMSRGRRLDPKGVFEDLPGRRGDPAVTFFGRSVTVFARGI